MHEIDEAKLDEAKLQKITNSAIFDFLIPPSPPTLCAWPTAPVATSHRQSQCMKI